MPSSDLPLLRHVPIQPGARWIYSAGFNVSPDLRSTERIDGELADITRILSAGGRLAILSHQGDYVAGTARPLDFVATYLTTVLGTDVTYVPTNATEEAAARAWDLAPGTAAVFGNTRHHPGEQRNDPDLALRFAALGDQVAIGGFSKAHRAHASNVGIVQHRSAYLTDAVTSELDLLAPWSGESSQFSVAVLGGLKHEKTTVGLTAASAIYDVVVPGGAVLVSLLRALEYQVGTSARGDDPDRTRDTAYAVLQRGSRARIHLPDEVVVSVGGGPGQRVPVDRIPADAAIVDAVLQPWVLESLARLRRTGGRAFLAGPPGLYAGGHRLSTDLLLASMRAPGVDALLLGGDTIAELPWSGPVSVGGGAALHQLAHGTTPVVEAIRSQCRCP